MYRKAEHSYPVGTRNKKMKLFQKKFTNIVNQLKTYFLHRTYVVANSSQVMVSRSRM